MLTPAQIAELNALVDHEIVETARAAYAAVTTRAAALPAQIAEAERVVTTARAARAALLDRAAKGQSATAEEAASAARAESDAVEHLRFLTDSKTNLDAEVRKAHDALAEAQRLSVLPVIRHGARLRLDAAARLDQARAALAAAEADYDAASAIIAHASVQYRPTAQLVPGTRQLSQNDQVKRYPIRNDAEAEAALWRSAGIEI